MLGLYLFFKAMAWMVKVCAYIVAGMVAIAAAVTTFVVLLLVAAVAALVDHYKEKKACREHKQPGLS